MMSAKTSVTETVKAISCATQTSPEEVQRELAVETPVAIVIQGTSVAVMMASPSDIEDFAIGFATTEGFIESLPDVEKIEVERHEVGIEARLWLEQSRAKTFVARRRAMLGPIGCGLCGIDSLDEALRVVPKITDLSVKFSRAQLSLALDQLRAHQPIHDKTKSAHAAGFVVPGQGIVCAREDVGRHNALDKLVGARLRAGNSCANGALVMTSRLSVDLVQKAAMAGCPVLVGASAPTSLAVEIAVRSNITLIAHGRGADMHVYSAPDRLED